MFEYLCLIMTNIMVTVGPGSETTVDFRADSVFYCGSQTHMVPDKQNQIFKKIRNKINNK